MTTASKKPQSKPAAKEKASRTPQPLNPWASDSHLIDGIAARVEELARELKAANQKLDYLLVRAAPLNREEWHPLVEQASKCIDL